MREKSACAALNRTPSANGGAVPASDHLLIARRSAQADDHAAKTLLFEVPYSYFGDARTDVRFHARLFQIPLDGNDRIGGERRDGWRPRFFRRPTALRS